MCRVGSFGLPNILSGCLKRESNWKINRLKYATSANSRHRSLRVNIQCNSTGIFLAHTAIRAGTIFIIYIHKSTQQGTSQQEKVR